MEQEIKEIESEINNIKLQIDELNNVKVSKMKSHIYKFIDEENMYTKYWDELENDWHYEPEYECSICDKMNNDGYCTYDYDKIYKHVHSKKHKKILEKYVIKIENVLIPDLEKQIILLEDQLECIKLK